MFNTKVTSKLIASSLLLVGIVGVAPKAMADDFIFNGTVPTTCAFATTPTTTLTVNQAARTFSGTAATATVNCNKSTATLQITSVTEGGSNPATADQDTDIVATANLTGVTTASLTANRGVTGSTTQTLGLGATSVDLSLNADLSNNTVLPAGSYAYTVTMTITP